MKIRRLAILLLVMIANNASANIRLPAIFSDGMVLQQRSKVAIWGWADAGESVTVSFSWAGRPVQVKTDVSGNWKLTIPTPGGGGPYQLKIRGKNSIELKDVLIGEVWLCSGQSNMVFSLKGSENAQQEIAVADLPAIRYFSVSRQYGTKEFDDCRGSQWQRTSPQTAPSFSAVAYYFAKKIHQQLKVPVGIIYSAWGGTPAEAWTPGNILEGDTVLSAYIDRWKEIVQKVGADSTKYHSRLKEWEKATKTTDSASFKKPAEPQTLYYYHRPWREPSVLFNGMINPVIPYSIKGFLWYQGESNVSYADEYSRLFGSMIKSWRNRWKQQKTQKDLPFYFVQLAPYRYNDLDAAARLRQGQEQVTKELEETGMAVTIDLGDMKDIHFTRKKEVGERLAFIALARNYGDKRLVFEGPVVKKMNIENGSVRLQFDQKLMTTNKKEPEGFEIGYRDNITDSVIFVKAEAKIEDNRIILASEQVLKPVAIRYAWLEIAEANIINDHGLPAAPFSKRLNN